MCFAQIRTMEPLVVVLFVRIPIDPASLTVFWTDGIVQIIGGETRLVRQIVLLLYPNGIFLFEPSEPWS
jgi:hypothetical protein